MATRSSAQRRRLAARMIRRRAARSGNVNTFDYYGPCVWSQHGERRYCSRHFHWDRRGRPGRSRLGTLRNSGTSILFHGDTVNRYDRGRTARDARGEIDDGLDAYLAGDAAPTPHHSRRRLPRKLTNPQWWD